MKFNPAQVVTVAAAVFAADWLWKQYVSQYV